MLRLLLAIVLIPLTALLGWLALGVRAPRADFVLTSTEPRTLDPHRVSWLPEIQLAAAMFEGLTRLNPDTFAVEPAVAAAWDPSDNARRFTFHLRPEARWSNGEPVTAADFHFAWLRVLDPRAECQYASLLFVLRGAEAYYRSRLDTDERNDVPATAVGLAAADPATLDVELAVPCPYFLELTAFVTLAPVHRPTLERWAYRSGRVLRSTQHLWTRPAHNVTNGAITHDAWNFKRNIWLRRNPFYWDAAAIAVNSIEAVITSDPTSALVAYETGRVDFVRWLDRPVAAALAGQQAAGRRSDFHTGDRFATFFYRVNCRRPPLDNADLRAALSLAIDREALSERVLRLGEPAAYTLVPRPALSLMPRATPDGGVVYYEPPEGLGARLAPAERVALARERLRRSGYDPRHDRPLEVLFPGGDAEQRSIAEALQEMWDQNLGLRVDLRQSEPKVLSTRIRNLDYDLARSDWFGDYLDPGSFLDLFVTGGGGNRTGWSNAEYDRLIAAAAAEPDNRRRFELFQAAEQILCEESLPIIPVFHRRGNYLLSPRFTGLNDNVRDLLPIHRVRPAGGR